MLKLKPNERVLDVGCGIGGGDFLMADKYDVYVHGMDLSVNMVLIALERSACRARKSKVGLQKLWVQGLRAPRNPDPALAQMIQFGGVWSTLSTGPYILGP